MELQERTGANLYRGGFRSGGKMTPMERFFSRANKTLLGAALPEDFIYFCNISQKYRYFYLATPKVACTTAILTLQKAELEDINVSADPPDVHDREHSPLLKPMQVGRLSALLESPEYFKFCFVRNPFTRLLSCYLDKIAGEHPVTFFQKSLILRQLGRQLDDMLQFVSFEEFVDAVAAQRLEEMESHWSVQWHHLCEGRIPFD